MPFDGTKLDNVTKLLIEARENIEKGWCQRNYIDGEGSVCILGAMGMRGWGDCTKERILAIERLGIAANISPNCLISWNDSPHRTKEEVLAAFDKAIGSA